MPIELPITLEFTRPLKTPQLPYRLCGLCCYVATWESARTHCPGCGKETNGEGLFWPEGALYDLWNDEVMCWNEKKPELATIVAAFYYEACEFNLLYHGLFWLDREFNTHNVGVLEYPDKEEKIWAFLNGLRTPKHRKKAFERVFKDDLKVMVTSVLGSDAEEFTSNHNKCREWRNLIAHTGRRVYVDLGRPDEDSEMARDRDRMLQASLVFVPMCWVVFSRVWNRYIHEPMKTAR